MSGPAAARVSDKTTGHECFLPSEILKGSNNVFINSKPAARLTDPIKEHCCPIPIEEPKKKKSKLKSSSSSYSKATKPTLTKKTITTVRKINGKTVKTTRTVLVASSTKSAAKPIKKTSAKEEPSVSMVMDCHSDKISTSSKTVFINGKGAARVGDRAKDSSPTSGKTVTEDKIKTGSPNVFIG